MVEKTLEKKKDVIVCPYCYANGLQIEFKEHYADNLKEYKCKVCNKLFMHK